MKPLTIGGRKIHIGAATLVIAEIGVNHDGSVQRAIELVHAAKGAGADAVKLQLFRADRLMHPSSAFAEYQRDRVGDATPADMLRRFELSDDAAGRVADEIRNVGLLPIATPFSPGDLPLARSLDLAAVKIASPDLVNKPLLRAAIQLNRPLLISTGAATMAEVAMAVQWLEQWGASFALLHCISSYPTPIDQVNLCWIGELQNRFSAVVGYSDHATEAVCGALAVASGAAIIEKHLTYDTNAPGPDHAASFDPGQFAEYVRLIRQAEIFRGTSGKHVLAGEADVRSVSRQSLVVAREIKAGAILREEDFTVQRPGAGMPAAMINEVAGRTAARAIKAGEMIDESHLARIE